MKVVLLGSIPKGDDIRKGWSDWKIPYMDAIRRVLPGAGFVHGDTISDSAGPEMVVGHDLAQIKRADICVVDAREKLGAGTAQEIVIAKYLEKPVVTIIPRDTHHHKTDVTFHGVTLKKTGFIYFFMYRVTTLLNRLRMLLDGWASMQRPDRAYR